MNITQYQELAKRTMNCNLTKSQRRNNWRYGLMGEFGELVDLLKKERFHGHPRVKEPMVKEIGDVFWYMAAIESEECRVLQVAINKSLPELDTDTLIKRTHAAISKLVLGDDQYMSIVMSGILEICRRYEINPEEVLKTNIAKLEERYPEEFSTEDSIKRIDEGDLWLIPDVFGQNGMWTQNPDHIEDLVWIDYCDEDESFAADCGLTREIIKQFPDKVRNIDEGDKVVLFRNEKGEEITVIKKWISKKEIDETKS